MVKEFMRLARINPMAACCVAVVLVAALIWGTAASVPTDAQTASHSERPQGAAQVSQADAVLEQAKVVRVVDGDTLKVKTATDSGATVRMIGMDTPESVAQEESRNCEEGVIAADYTKSLVAPGQTVWLSRDVSDDDQYGRLLRYVWLEKPDDVASEGEIAAKMLNAILVREGYAQVKRYRPDTTLHDLFNLWGEEAAAAGKGVTYKWK